MFGKLDLLQCVYTACRTLFAVCPTCLCFYKMKKLFWVSPKQLLHDVFDAHRSELEKLANNSACDIIGLVTFVGRVERVKSKGKGKRCSYLVCCVEVVFDNWKNLFWSVVFTFLGPEKYWTYRWVHAVDGTSDHPFILELFSTSQAEIFSHICPSKSAVSSLLPHCKHASFFFKYILYSIVTYLVCTQMRVCHVEGSLPYLTSSCETETFITG